MRWIGEQHVREDCRHIPSVADWLAAIPMQAWMGNGVILGAEPDDIGDPRAAWVAAVTEGQTTMGLSDWLSHAQVV